MGEAENTYRSSQARNRLEYSDLISVHCDFISIASPIMVNVCIMLHFSLLAIIIESHKSLVSYVCTFSWEVSLIIAHIGCIFYACILKPLKNGFPCFIAFVKGQYRPSVNHSRPFNMLNVTTMCSCFLDKPPSVG